MNLFFFPSKFPICERVQLLGLEVYETDVSKIVSKFVLPLLYMLNCGGHGYADFHDKNISSNILFKMLFCITVSLSSFTYFYATSICFSVYSFFLFSIFLSSLSLL